LIEYTGKYYYVISTSILPIHEGQIQTQQVLGKMPAKSAHLSGLLPDLQKKSLFEIHDTVLIRVSIRN